MITDEMVEAAAGAYWFEVYGKHRKQPCKWPDDVYGNSQVLFRDGCHAALEAAFAAMPKPEPVAWRHRLVGAPQWFVSNEGDPSLANARCFGKNFPGKVEIEPLYAAPPAPAVSVKEVIEKAIKIARKNGDMEVREDIQERSGFIRGMAYVSEAIALDLEDMLRADTSPEPAVFTVEQIIAKIKDYGQDSFPGSEYRQACDDLIEEFSGDASQRVPETAAPEAPHE